MSNTAKIGWVFGLLYWMVGVSVALGQPCPNPNPILGSNLVCPASQEVYSLTTDNSPASTYVWELLNGGGTIVSGTTTFMITIDWSDMNGGPYTLRCTEQVGACFYQNELVINVADDVARYPFNCFSEVNIPYELNCEKLVLPEHVLASGRPDCDNSFELRLTVGDDVEIENPVGIAYLNQVVSATVIHVASGRACTSRITLKDGSAPQLICENDTTICNDLRAWDPFGPGFKIPTVIDNCADSLVPIPDGYEWINLVTDTVFSAQIIRGWRAVDNYGNASTCNDTIFLRRIDFDEIVCPVDTVIACDADYFDINDPLTAGVPTFEGLPIYAEKSYCDFSIEYEDKIIPQCPGAFRIHREWILIDVSGPMALIDTCHQIIDIVDTSGPIIEFDTDKITYESHDLVWGINPDRMYKTIRFPTLDYDCVAHGYFPRPVISDACGSDDEIQVDIVWTNNHLSYLNGDPDSEHLHFSNMPQGKHMVIVQARDECHNISTDTLVAIAEDVKAPYFTTDRDPVVALGAYAEITWIDVSVFDEGTYDNCSLYKILGRRVDWETACGYTADSTVSSSVRNHYDNFWQWLHEDPDSMCVSDIGYGWTDQIPFCCADACSDHPVVVELIAIDAHCNIAKAWVNVEVEDKSAPEVKYRLPDLEISCYAYNNYYRDHVEEGNWEVFGKYDSYVSTLYGVETSKSYIKDRICLEEVPEYEYNPYHPHEYTDEDFYEWITDTIDNGLVLENCGLSISETQKTFFESCGEGWIERTFVFKGACSSNKADSTVVKQKIKIYNDCPLHEYEIIWPSKDTTIYSCNLVEVETPEPRLRYPDECREIGIHSDDQVISDLYNADSTCIKIIRTWSVIDWCRQTEPYHDEWAGNQNYHYYEYEQIIYIKNQYGPEIQDCDLDTVCIANDCYGTLNTTIAVTDDCTPVEEIEIEWSLYKRYNDTYLPLDRGEGANAYVENLQEGEYKLTWEAMDGCNNLSVCSDRFEVVDCKKPVPICLSSTTVKLYPVDLDQDGQIDTAVGEIWAYELNVSSHDNCSNDLDYRVRWKGTGTVDAKGNLLPPDSSATKLSMGCRDVGQAYVEMWVIDPSGNADFCEVLLTIQGPIEGCSGEIGKVKGRVSNMKGAGINDATMTLTNVSGTKVTSVTNEQGSYDFGSYKMDGSNYFLQPSKVDLPIEGISTFDLLQLAKYLRNKIDFESVFERRAADINGDGKHSVQDLTILRKFILGKIDALPGEKTWRFFNSEMEETSALTQLSGQIEKMDFTGVKIGDINGNAADSESTARSGASRYVLNISDQDLNQGQDYTFNIYASEDILLEGIQSNLVFDTDAIEILKIESGALDLHQDDTDLRRDHLRMAWISADSPIDVKQGDLLYSVHIRCKQRGSLQDVISLGSRFISNEIYEYADDLPRTLGLQFVKDQNITMAQNHPNPFTSVTKLSIQVDKEQDGVLFIRGLDGKMYHERKLWLKRGENLIEVDRPMLGPAGTYVYTLVCGETIISRKMIVM